MVATIPRTIGTRVRAIRTAPDSEAARPGWVGSVTKLWENKRGESLITVSFPRDGWDCHQDYFVHEWTTENVEVLESAQ